MMLDGWTDELRGPLDRQGLGLDVLEFRKFSVASKATEVAGWIEESLPDDAEILRLVRGLRAVADVLGLRLEGRQRRAREQTAREANTLHMDLGKCAPYCLLVPRFCTCGAGYQCTECGGTHCASGARGHH